MHRVFGWVSTVALTGFAAQFLVAVVQALSSHDNSRWLLIGLVVCLVIALVTGVGWYLTKPEPIASPLSPPTTKQAIADTSGVAAQFSAPVSVGRDLLIGASVVSPAAPEKSDAEPIALTVKHEVARDHMPHWGSARAFLRLTNTSGSQVQKCYVRLDKLVWVMSYVVNNEKKIKEWSLFGDRDIYFQWQGVKERYHTFHSSSVVEIAFARSGDGNGAWSAHPDTPPNHGIQYFDDYLIRLEIAADNLTPQLFAFRLRLFSRSRKEGNEIWLEPSGTPPHMDFESINPQSVPDMAESRT